MGIGTAIVLIVAGLILVSGALNFDIGAIEETTIGWILLGAGVLGLVLSFALANRTRRTEHVEEKHVDGHITH